MLGVTIWGHWQPQPCVFSLCTIMVTCQKITEALLDCSLMYAGITPIGHQAAVLQRPFNSSQVTQGATRYRYYSSLLSGNHILLLRVGAHVGALADHGLVLLGRFVLVSGSNEKRIPFGPNSF